LPRNALHIIFTAIVLSVVTYALPSFADSCQRQIKPVYTVCSGMPLGEVSVAVLLALMS